MTLGAVVVLLIGIYADFFSVVASLFNIRASGEDHTEQE